jgi:lambda repressor-like predicted transcriptional regulator
MNFKHWLILSEEQLFNEDFKTQREKFIQQGIEPDAVDYYLNTFKNIKDKKYKQINDPIPNLEHIKDRTNIDAFKIWKELEDFVDYVKSQADVSGKTNYKNIKVDATPIYEDNDLIIYYADSPQACVTYKGNVPYSWCVARTDSSNMFYNYRFGTNKPSFYFVKNKERTNKELETFKGGTFTDEYHFFVIQVVKYANPENKDNQQYIVTSAQNIGDKQMSWNDILKLEPKLTNKENIFISKPLGIKEEELYKKFRNGISDKEFENLPFDEKDMYLSVYVRQDRPITANQFKILPPDLKNKYIGFGVGLSDEQVEMIDSKLYKRYEDVTKTKIEKTIGTEEFKLTPSEVNILLKNINEFDLNKLSDGNVRDLLKYAPDKDNMAELIIQKKSELTRDNVSILLYNATNKEEMAELIKTDNISKLNFNDVINLVQSATDKDKMAELLIKYKKKLHDADGWSSIISPLLISAKNKYKIAELIIQKETELSSLHLVHHDDVEALLYYPNDREKIAALLGTDNIDRLEDNNVNGLIKKLDGKPLELKIIAKILGEKNISKLSYDSVKNLLSKSYPKKENIAKILNQYYTNKTPQIKRLINKHLKTKTPPE